MSGKGGNEQTPRTIPVYRSLDEVPAGVGPVVASIGNFDGVHCGHRAILAGAVEDARTNGMKSMAVTFNPHPEQVLRPAQAPKQIVPLEERLRLLATTGLDAVLVLPFNEKLAHMSPREFAQEILAGLLGARSLHEGHNFRFGYRARGGVNELAEFGKEFGWTIRIHPFVRIHGLEVSSTAVRDLIAAGDVRRARWMLGRSFTLFSKQARGRGIGVRLLVPTVNLANIDGLLPGFGVYVTRLKIAGRQFNAVTNVGNRPTFGEASFAVESHILNFEPMDLDENTPLEVEFLYRLRGEIAWPSPEALKQQIFKDVAHAKRYFRLAHFD
jgi:riboflavin kinase / FMN adenylyltransferase